MIDSMMFDDLIPPTNNNLDTDFLFEVVEKSILSQIQTDVDMIKRNVETNSNETRQSIRNIEIQMQKLAEGQTYMTNLLERLFQSRQTPLPDKQFPQQPRNDFVLPKVHKGKIPIAQYCCEINAGTTDDAPALITSTAHVSASSSQVQSIPMTYELSQQTQPINIEQKISFLHPFDERISAQTDRHTLLKDVYGQPPILVLNGCHFPVGAEIEIAPVSRSEHGTFFSLYQFHDKIDGYERVKYRSIHFNNTNSQQIKLDNLRLCKICNNDMKNGSRFQVRSYPEDTIVQTLISSPKDLNSQYRFDRIQLAVRIRLRDDILFNDILYSNYLTTEGKVKLLNSHDWKVNPLFSSNDQLSFNSDNQMQMRFNVEIPNTFHGTIGSGMKYLRVSLVTNGKQSLAYSVTPEVVPIRSESFELNLKVRKKTFEEFCNNRDGHIPYSNFNTILKSNDLHNFIIEMNVYHQDDTPTGETKIYDKCSPWQSAKFIEMMNIAQKRTHDQMDQSR